MIGIEAFDSDESLGAVATRAADDVGLLNQEACVCSRSCSSKATGIRSTASASGFSKNWSIATPSPARRRRCRATWRQRSNRCRILGDDFGLWGKGDGSGLVVRSDEPVDFHPINKTANVVPVKSLKDALKYVNVATQTVGVYPPARQAELRDGLACGGAQTNRSAGGCRRTVRRRAP